METLNEYDQQALDFLTKTGVSIDVKFSHHGNHFDNEDVTRDIYNITISRGERKYEFKFGQSIFHSGRFILGYKNRFMFNKMPNYTEMPNGYQLREVKKNPNFEGPTPYSVLACLTKYDPESLEVFCDEFGYDVDSKKAEKLYNAVDKQYKALLTLFNDEEFELLREIQ